MLVTRPELNIKHIEDFFDVINSNESSTFLHRFRVNFSKYIRNLLLQHQLSPNKKLPHIKTLMMDAWQQMLTANLFANTLSGTTIGLIENDLRNGCPEIKLLWKDYKDEIDSFIQNLENSISNKNHYPDSMSIAPSRLSTGRYRSQADSYPIITELTVGIEYFKNKFYESAVGKFQQGIDKINLISIESFYAKTLVDLKKHKAYALHAWALERMERKFYDEAFKHARDAIIELDNMNYEDLSIEDHHTLMGYINFYLEVFNEYSLKLEHVDEFKKAIELYRSVEAETRPVLKMGAAPILKMLARTYFYWGIKTTINESANSGLQYFELGLAEYSKIPPGSTDSNALDLITCFNAAITLCCWLKGWHAFTNGQLKEAAENFIRSLQVQPVSRPTCQITFLEMIRKQNLYWLSQTLVSLTHTLTDANEISAIIANYKTNVTNEEILWAIDKVLYYNLISRAQIAYHSNDHITAMNYLKEIPISQTPISLGMLPNDHLLDPTLKYHQFIFQMNILYRVVLLKNSLSPVSDVAFILTIQKFLATILLAQGLSMKNSAALCIAKMKMFVTAHGLFNLIPLPARNERDIASLNLSKANVNYLSYKLIDKIQNLTTTLETRINRRTYFFNERSRKSFKDSEPALRLLINKLNTFDRVNRVESVYELSNYVSDFIQRNKTNVYIKSIKNIQSALRAYLNALQEFQPILNSNSSTMESDNQSPRPRM